MPASSHRRSLLTRIVVPCLIIAGAAGAMVVALMAVLLGAPTEDEVDGLARVLSG